MEILIEKDNKKINMRYTGKVGGLLQKLKVNPETVIVVRNGELLADDDQISEPDKIKLMSVISGG